MAINLFFLQNIPIDNNECICYNVNILMREIYRRMVKRQNVIINSDVIAFLEFDMHCMHYYTTNLEMLMISNLGYLVFEKY